jgi:hypothetical protein
MTRTLSVFLAVIGSMAAPVLSVQPKSTVVMVQTVDATWSPIPGAEVQMKERRGKRRRYKATTNREGFAEFRLEQPEDQQSFDISATLDGFKKKEMKDVGFGGCRGDCDSNRYIQLRLEVGGPTYTIQ